MGSKKLAIRNLSLKDAFVIEPFSFEDGRGPFHKTFTKEILKSAGASASFAEEFISSSKKGVIRGMHFQNGKFAQAKLITCLRGKIFDIIVDLRKSSQTFGKIETIELSEKNMLSLYVPAGFAHGYLSLEDNSQVIYRASAPHNPAEEGGIIYSDKTLNLPWPKMNYTISEKDKKWPSFEECCKFE